MKISKERGEERRGEKISENFEREERRGENINENFGRERERKGEERRR